MLPDQVSNPGPLTYESGALLIALRGPAVTVEKFLFIFHRVNWYPFMFFCQFISFVASKLCSTDSKEQRIVKLA